MVEDKGSQLKKFELEIGKTIREKSPEIQAAEEGKVEGAVPTPEKKERVGVYPNERQKVLDEIERFENGQNGGLAGIIASGQSVKEREKRIEKIMENGLEDIYLSLPADKQREFKLEGEKTMKEINVLLDKVKVNIGKIANLIKKWLSLIPGVNKFFLEQEAKIKADEIMKLKRE
ncbi:MAG: hypothetical protein PHR36_03845 [Patescibacteria group bacterium]|nr:hypothetical protein [Patescibacteria group bacterium]